MGQKRRKYRQAARSRSPGKGHPSLENRGEHDCGRQDGKQDDSLDANEAGEPDCGERERLAGKRRALEGQRDRQGSEQEGRQEAVLAHQHARVQKRRHQRSQASRENRIAHGGQAPGPEVDEHEREHAQADIDDLRQRVGRGLSLRHEPRRRDQHDVAEVRPGDRLAPDVKCAVVSHATRQVAIDQLVDQDPWRDDPARKPDVDDRCCYHQPYEREERPSGGLTAYGLKALAWKLASLGRLLNCQGRPSSGSAFCSCFNPHRGIVGTAASEPTLNRPRLRTRLPGPIGR